MELLEAIYGRRSTRCFTTEPVARKTLEELVDAAIQAPNAVNAQPWHFTIIQGSAFLDSIAVNVKAYMLKTVDRGAAPDRIREHLDNPHFHVFYHAPAVVLISAKIGDSAVEDVGLAAENLMLAAYGQGLGTCWIGFAQRWLETEDGKRAVDLPGDHVPIAPIIVGHPREPMPPVPRKPPVLRWIG